MVKVAAHKTNDLVKSRGNNDTDEVTKETRYEIEKMMIFRAED